MSQFGFLQREWPTVFDSAVRAEAEVHSDSRTACFYARRALELAIAWAYARHGHRHSRGRELGLLQAGALENQVLADVGPWDAATDLTELERMLVESGVGGAEQVQRAASESHGLGLFVRSLVGMDREAAKEALAGFLSGKSLDANQIEFVNLVVDHLTQHGVVEARMLYESPFTDLTPRGPDELFTSPQVDELVQVLEVVRARATATL